GEAAPQQASQRLRVQQLVGRRHADPALVDTYVAHARHPIHTLHNVCMMCMGPGQPAAPVVPPAARAHGCAASASGRGAAPHEATTSVAIARNRPPVATVLVAPSCGLCRVTTTTTRGSSAGTMPATLSVYWPGA